MAGSKLWGIGDEPEYNVDTTSEVSGYKSYFQPLRSDPAQRDPNVVCDYHGTHGHRTEDCRQLRDEVAPLLKNGYLREFLSEWTERNYKNREANKQVEPVESQHVIYMIISGAEIPRGPMMKRTKVSTTREKRTRNYVPEGSISFNDEDAEGSIQLHNEALVISVLINKSQVKRILINPGSSANIIRWKVVEQLGLLDQIVPVARVLYESIWRVKIRRGELLCRPWVHNMRAAPSMLHQMLKFPTPEGVKKVHGEQPATREMFAVEEAAPVPKALVLKAVEKSVKGKDVK
ncbi:uncharacterized protein LOC132620001 [Lycium barbarum]|uniref:uncharacterized protein LOC132620001 n=1 Tax=Lycium barbarum TaxID=112863 RepID=UPI00293F1DAA|nr:uncharacterized protein LOC132620001 [Lycium barbarum]